MKDKKPKHQQPVPEPQEELTAIEKWVDQLKPYGSMIALGIALCFLAFIAIVYFIQATNASKEAEWRQLNISITELGNSGNTNGLKQVAEEYPEGKAGLWALQIAGDYDLRTGISQLSYDREGGLKLIAKARESLQGLVDAPATEKSTMLQRRSIFSLAYADESLGEFEKAKALYQQIVDAAPDSAFAAPARRGLERCTNPQYVVLFEKFKTWEDPLGDAPGPSMSELPNISFPDMDENSQTGGGGEFGSTPEDATAIQDSDKENDTDTAGTEPPADPESPSDADSQSVNEDEDSEGGK